jgi:Spy/CpxP family protein refolding chaperone
MIHGRYTWLPAIVLTGGLLLASAASAQSTAVPAARTPGAGITGSLQATLGLTEDQMKTVREIHSRQAPARKELGEALERAEADLRQLAVNGADPAALQAKQAEVTQLLSRSVAMRVESLQALAAVLTPEQRAKLAQMNADVTNHGQAHHRRPQGS